MNSEEEKLHEGGLSRNEVKIVRSFRILKKMNTIEKVVYFTIFVGYPVHWLFLLVKMYSCR